MSIESRAPLLTCLLAAALLTACGSTQPRAAIDFWSEAEPDPIVTLEPARKLPKDATSLTEDLEAVVVEQGPGRLAGSDYTMDLRTPAGDRLALHYRLGGRRSIPVKQGESVRISSWHRVGAFHELFPLGLVVTANRQGVVPLAVMDAQDSVPLDRLPKSLTTLKPTDLMAWQNSERLRNECHLAVIHQQFSIGADPAAARKSAAPPRLLPPGGRIRLWDGTVTYDVVVLDNRQILNTTCVPKPTAWYGWSAIWMPDKGPPILSETPPAPKLPAPKPAAPPSRPPGSKSNGSQQERRPR